MDGNTSFTHEGAQPSIDRWSQPLVDNSQCGRLLLFAAELSVSLVFPLSLSLLSPIPATFNCPLDFQARAWRGHEERVARGARPEPVSRSQGHPSGRPRRISARSLRPHARVNETAPRRFSARVRTASTAVAEPRCESGRPSSRNFRRGPSAPYRKISP